MSKELISVDLQPEDLMKITAATGLVPRELVPYVKPAMEEFRNEMAAELGLTDYASMDKGELPSRQNGKVGGGMTKKMVAFAEAVLAWNYKNRVLLKES
ncbi:alpha/beta-type small acid-soluble spore protein [Desulforamulus aquiferis]|uniref:Alpha/beta-type small acid-soluble spore protein n=1 Tax=Desulforamulus aquiferis TaxID=1397668 RepID=A0AAW7Z9M8_9FIRM|nr:alpha/beta-type small acid-soluble spore protein [Desulforamulus aquiferis]MDO7786428.1 alpha/beta-type small acid-soluble spore protein [Desulforamulus aquiferis]